MLIQHKKIGTKGMFFIEQDGNILAEMVYSMGDPDRMIIEHTEVDNELKGQNIGHQLVHTGVEYARTHNLRIVPLCSFAGSVFKKHVEYKDVL